MATPYDALLIVSFGGPEKREDVIPFLENVLRGRNVPRERMLAVAEHYYHFDGVSPINQQNRDLIAALQKELPRWGLSLPIYWGNRNWDPYLTESLREMRDKGIKRVLAFVTSAFSSYSGCRQYREDILRAQDAIGAGAPQIDKIRVFFNHPLFIDAARQRIQGALLQLSNAPYARQTCHVVFTAHSIPISMSQTSDYVIQLEEARRILMHALQMPLERSSLVYQSRSGRPQDPWLEPDILDHLKTLKSQGHSQILLVPLGFLSDHMEVLYDLDYEARQLGSELGLEMVRAGTVGHHPAIIRMIAELIREYQDEVKPRALGVLGPRVRNCADNCCPAPVRPATAAPATP
ncbi:MAG: ferrochelatase [Planctomycetales bacterium]